MSFNEKIAPLFLSFVLMFVCLDLNAAEPLSDPESAIQMTDYFKVFLGLVFVIGLFLLSTFLFKRFGNGPMLGRGQLRIVDGLHIGNRERLMLVEFKDKQILLAITPGGISKLDTIDVPANESSVNSLSNDADSGIVNSPGATLQAQ